MTQKDGQKPLAVQLVDALTKLVNAIAEGGLLLWLLIVIIIMVIADPSVARDIVRSLF